MATERKEKLIRVLQLMESTDEKSPMNANQIVEKLDDEYTLGDIDRRSIYRDISMLQYCGYKIKQWGVCDMFPRTSHVEMILEFSL